MTRRKILDAFPKEIEVEKTKKITKKKPPKEKKERKKHEPVSGEKDYKWCYEAELPVITATFEKGKLIEEKTNDEIVR